MHWHEKYQEKVKDAAHAVEIIRPGNRVFIGSGAGEPQALVEALSEKPDIIDTEIVHILTLGVATYVEEKFSSRFRHNAYFIGENVRKAVAEGRADYTPIFLSEIPRLFKNRRVIIDVAFISVSPPDEHGYCSYGVSTDIVKSATEAAGIVVAEVNEQMPRALGDCFIHARDIDILVPVDRPILETPHHPPDDLSQNIARHISKLIEDGATLQLGIGTIPDAVLNYLDDFKDLGIHTEMFSDGIISLVEKGVITNSAKTLHPGKIIASFVMGSRKLYDFIDNNPLVEFHPTEYTNDPFIISQNQKMISINSAIEVDLSGQICADSLGKMFYSGIGGQVDFVRGAARSPGGKPIIALPSTAQDGNFSRIVPTLKEGAGVVTSRGDVHYVVTEYGTAYLHGKNIRERALALIQIAHPKFRPWLLAEAKARHLVYSDQIELPVHIPVYPQQLEKWVTLKGDSKVYIRPLKLTDESLVKAMFYQLSKTSIQHRFFHMVRAMPHKKIQDLIRIDYENDMLLVVLTNASEDSEMIGIAHYSKDARTNFAEAAFLVRDDWQGKGIGSILLKELASAAQQNGIAGFTAEVLMDNSGMMRVFHGGGYKVESRLADGIYMLKMPFNL